MTIPDTITGRLGILIRLLASDKNGETIAAEFVNDMAARTVWHQPTERQEKWLKSIFFRLGGKL